MEPLTTLPLVEKFAVDERASLPTLKREARLRLIETLTVLFVVIMAVLTLARYASGVPLTKTVLVVEGGYSLVLLGVARLARRSRSLVWPGWLVVLGLLLTILVAAQGAGGINAPILVALPFVPMLAALLLGRRSLPLFLAIAAVMMLGLYGLQQLGWAEIRPLDEQRRSLIQFTVVVSMTLLYGWLGFYCDRQNEQMYDQLSLWANTDGLTGVANRRFFDERFTQEWLRNQRVSRPLSLFVVDIDYFKRYNDTYGHVEGDRCLKAIAQTIANHCRRSGEVVARYGGEEFAVILPNVNLAEAAAIAEGLRLKIEALHSKGNPDVRETVTVSIGFASTVPHEFALRERFIVQADQALYRAKRAGRNQSVGAMVQGGRVNAQ